MLPCEEGRGGPAEAAAAASEVGSAAVALPKAHRRRCLRASGRAEREVRVSEQRRERASCCLLATGTLGRAAGPGGAPCARRSCKGGDGRGWHPGSL